MHQNSGLSHPYQLGCLEIYGWSRLCEIKSVTCYCRQLCHNHTHKCTKIHLTNQQTSLLFLSGGLLESLFHPNISWGICDTLWAISFCHAFFFFCKWLKNAAWFLSYVSSKCAHSFSGQSCTSHWSNFSIPYGLSAYPRYPLKCLFIQLHLWLFRRRFPFAQDAISV